MAATLILTHGAGSNREAPLLLAIEAALARTGLRVIRANLAFREARPSGPPRRGDAEQDRQGLRELVEAARAGGAGRVFLGGHSYGGRQATMLAAEQPGLVDALLLLSYPLHPPDKPDQPRTAHLPQLRTPALFVHGTRDPFGTIGEMEASVALVAAPAPLVEIAGAGHDLKVRRSFQTVAEAVAEEWAKFLERTSTQG